MHQIENICNIIMRRNSVMKWHNIQRDCIIPKFLYTIDAYKITYRIIL